MSGYKSHYLRANVMFQKFMLLNSKPKSRNNYTQLFIYIPFGALTQALNG